MRHPESMWVPCSECIYWDECEEKECVDGCVFGEAEGELDEVVD